MLREKREVPYPRNMVFYRFPRQQEVITSPDIPETIGIATEQAFNFARAARACITLDSTNLTDFQCNLPQEAPDYHSFDDLTELIWRSWLQRTDIKSYAIEKPHSARGKSIAIWKNLIAHGAPTVAEALGFSYYESTQQAAGKKSALRRTLISDPTVYDFYERARSGLPPAGIGPTALTAIQMLLAGTHTDLIEPDWPEEVLEFMGDSSVGNDQLPPPTSY